MRCNEIAKHEKNDTHTHRRNEASKKETTRSSILKESKRKNANKEGKGKETEKKKHQRAHEHDKTAIKLRISYGK